jgi:ubiquinone/menaquinone biosynthesis C-methylase UbiE
MEIENTYVFQTYSQIAHHFNNTRHYKWPCVENFLKFIPSNSLILDIGCGNGRNMLNPNHIFIGFDTCPEFLSICKSKGLSTLYNDMTQIPFRDNTFDALLSIASFHHLATIERRMKSLNEMYRILKPGGKLLLTIWSKNQPNKTKRIFENYGNNYVAWKSNNTELQRYYYIFKVNELITLAIAVGFQLDNNYWDCGNEVFIFSR